MKRLRLLGGRALLAAGLVAGWLAPGPAQAQAVIHVPADFSTIQAAITAATPGDTVLVAPGVYIENINFSGKAILVISEGGAGVTFIDGDASGPVVEFSLGEGRASVLSGFTLQGGDNPEGGGILINSSSPTITGNSIVNNTGCDGVGIAVISGAPLIRGNLISHNVRSGCTGSRGGGGILVRGTSNAEILENLITDNIVPDGEGGGILLDGAAAATLRDNVISGNNASGTLPVTRGGGLLLLNSGSTVVLQNVITKNSAGADGRGGGIAWNAPSGNPGAILLNNTIFDNNAPQGGSGIFADGFDTPATLMNNLVVARAGQSVVYCGSTGNTTAPAFKSNDVFNPGGGGLYAGICTNQTGAGGNISSDPRFADPAVADFGLLSTSPAVDKGNKVTTALPGTDFDGDARIDDGNNDGITKVDMGVEELTSGQTITVIPSPVTVTAGVTFQTEDFIARVTGATQKNVKFKVCDGNGQNCVTGGNSTLGTIAEIGKDQDGNDFAHYIPPTSVPAAPPCVTVPAGCQLILKAKLLNTTLSARATLILSGTPASVAPTLRDLNPSSATAGDPGFLLDVEGGDFELNSFIAWNGQAQETSFGPSALDASIPSAFLDVPESAEVTVITAAGAVSNSRRFRIDAGNPRLVERSSRNTSGTQGDSQSGSAAAGGTGRYVVFQSDADNLVASDLNGATDVFWRDTCLGAKGCSLTTKRVSVATAGTEGNGPSSSPAVTPDGRFVVFLSLASNLVASDNNGAQDVFLRDTCESTPVSCTPSTTRVSVSTAGVEGAGSSGSTAPALSADGRFLVFDSAASNLVASDTNGVADVFLRDTCQGAPPGCTTSTTRVSVSNTGTEGSGSSTSPVVSDDGRFIAFASTADNLVSADTNGAADIFLRDTCRGTGSNCAPSTVRLSVSTSGTQGDNTSSNPAMSADGRFITFASLAENLVGSDNNGARDVFVRDTCLGVTSGCAASTRRVSVATDGTQGNAQSGSPAISADGRFVAFSSAADNLVAGDTNGVQDIFLRDTCARGGANCTVATLRVSVSAAGAQGNAASSQPALSRDGHFVAYTSLADNLVGSDVNGVADVFLGRTGR